MPFFVSKYEKWVKEDDEVSGLFDTCPFHWVAFYECSPKNCPRRLVDGVTIYYRIPSVRSDFISVMITLGLH